MPIPWGRLRSITVRQVISALGRDGFYLQRNSSSHQIYRHPDGRRVTVSFHHPRDTFKADTLRSIIERQAIWTEEDLRRLGLL